MKYKRGSIVEVSVKDKLCYQSWRCAQIVSGNGGNYTVSYDVYPGFTDEADVERISVKYIRPCPPLLENSEHWVPGDVVEVFHNLSWKMAIVLKDFGWDQFQVRLVGSFKELEVSKSELRVRQACQNGEWTVIGKVPRDYKDPNCNKLLVYDQDSGFLTKQREAEGDFYIKDLCFDPQIDNHLESHIVSSKTLKRVSPYGHSQGKTNQGGAQKFRMSEKEGTRVRVLVKSPEKVDAIANSREMLCEKDLHIAKENINGTFGSSRALTLELNDADSVMSSSGSCSINSYCGSGPVEEIEGHDSDAESVCQLGYQEKIDQSPTNSALSDEIHRLELHAYRCTPTLVIDDSQTWKEWQFSFFSSFSW
ncbi:Agenet-like domain-containing protein [Cynara cardunculus var. scolymus]|uniref:Agenet-like domain-containing protein n=1 Tax=Cynara cardunculus var. scolymus TaxID=59895 RepID=A0A103Y2E0_CYNCS|nr:Agenet-like domain-containing protein [Cynara cardunculus var. scolymus]